MRVKIVSDGTAAGTAVLNAETGEILQGVEMVNFMASTDGECEALMHVVGIQCEIVCNAHATLLPNLNPYQAEDLSDDEDSSD